VVAFSGAKKKAIELIDRFVDFYPHRPAILEELRA